MRPEDLREFAARSRGEVAAAKRMHWRRLVQTGDRLAAFDAAHALYDHARRVAGFADARYLADDLSHQLQLKLLIDRASQAIAVRRPAR